MQRTRVKICGVRDTATAEAAVEAGADAIGLVFAPGSPRQVTVEEAGRIVAALPALVQPVGLFVNADAGTIRDAAARIGLGTVQLHGEETPDAVAALTPLRVIKSIAFESRFVSDELRRWRGVPNLAGLLFDAVPTSAEDGQRGGTGRRLDWSALASLVHGGMMADLPPLILAGGLNAENVGEAIAALRPYALDVSSGVESERGIKCAARIRAFCAAVRAADGAGLPAAAGAR